MSESTLQVPESIDMFPIAPVIWVEGPIAVGKSTFARKLAELLGFEFIAEPVEANFYLEEFYKDPKAFAFGMQIFLLHYRYCMKQKSCFSSMLGSAKGFVLDRCVLGDKVFANLHWKAGNINKLDWKCYDYAYRAMAQTIQTPTLLVYLDAQPETCYQRMLTRKRPAEREVPLEYLKQLREGYKGMLEDIRHGRNPWGRRITVPMQLWDKVIPNDSPEWVYLAKTVLEACQIDQ